MGHMSYKCPKNLFGDREPPEKKKKKRKREYGAEGEIDEEEEEEVLCAKWVKKFMGVTWVSN